MKYIKNIHYQNPNVIINFYRKVKFTQNILLLITYQLITNTYFYKLFDKDIIIFSVNSNLHSKFLKVKHTIRTDNNVKKYHIIKHQKHTRMECFEALNLCFLKSKLKNKT